MQERGSSNFVPPQPRDAESPRLSPESVRAYVNQTGGSRTGSTNHTRLREEPSFRSRSQPTGTVVSPGVPGYMGHVPHGVGREAHVVEGRTDHVAKFDDFSSRPHKAIDQDREHIPRKMPPPGYAGHLHQTVNSTECYGTSRYAPKTPPSREPRQMASDKEVPTFGWPASSGASELQNANSSAASNAAAIASKYTHTIETLGRF